MPGSWDLSSIVAGEQADAAGNAPDSTQPDARQDADSRESATGQDDGLAQRLNRLTAGHPSSPRNADGSQRQEAVDLSVLETADDADAPPGPADTADADDGASAEWRAELPRLQGEWEQHKGRWPAEQRAPVDWSNDEEGSWRGDAPGQYLNAEENLVTDHAQSRVDAAERELTGAVQGIDAEVPSIRLVGLENCIKGVDRFKEKVAEGLALKHERAVGQIIKAMPDALRYTYQLPVSGYVDSFRATCDRLQEHGYRWVFCRNSWENLDYKGVNTRWRNPAGQLFEVQFHTADSFAAKQFTHEAYERLRNTSTDPREMGELRQFQRTVSAVIKIPDRVSEILDFREKGD